MHTLYCIAIVYGVSYKHKTHCQSLYFSSTMSSRKLIFTPLKTLERTEKIEITTISCNANGKIILFVYTFLLNCNLCIARTRHC